MRSLLNVRLAEARMTKQELKRLTGISHNALWNYSKDEGIGVAPLRSLVRIADAIGCKVTDLYQE